MPLRMIGARLGTVSSRLAPAMVPGERDRRRDASVHWRQWYKTKAWQRLRWDVLVRDLFTCQLCKAMKADTSQLVADHKEPHRGEERLFWDKENLWALCKDCHDSAKKRAEAGLGI